jgi:hypothetical protein
MPVVTKQSVEKAVVIEKKKERVVEEFVRVGTISAGSIMGIVGSVFTLVAHYYPDFPVNLWTGLVGSVVGALACAGVIAGGAAYFTAKTYDAKRK